MNKFFIKAKSDYFIIAVILSLVSGVIVIACVFLNSGVFPFSPVKFSVFKPALGVTVENPFGVAYGEGSEYLSGFMADIRDLGVNRTKVVFEWNDLEPTPGSYNPSRVDAYLEQLQSADQALIHIFTTNDWCTSAAEHGSNKGAPFLDHPSCDVYGPEICSKSCKDYYYKNFITALANRVKTKANGGIKYWQQNSEPASARHYPKDHAADYVEAYKVYYNTVKSILPSAIVVGVNMNGDFTLDGQPRGNEAVNFDSDSGTYLGFFDYVMKNGKDYFDMLDVRLYYNKYSRTQTGEYPGIAEKVSWFTNKMREYGYEKPVISTEFGGPDPIELKDNLYNNTLDYAETNSTYIDATGTHLCISLPDWAQQATCAITWLNNVYFYSGMDQKLQIFFLYANQQQNDKRNRMQCHDIIQRDILILDAGVSALWRWNLQSNQTNPRFGNMRLMDSGHLNKIDPPYSCYQRMISKLGKISAIQKEYHADSNIYFYKITKSDSSDPIYIAWRRENGNDPYDAEAAPAVNATFQVGFSRVKITDVFGSEKAKTTASGVLILEGSDGISDKPIYIENNPDTQPPSIPSSLVATAISQSQVNLSWAASSDDTGVTGYLIYRGGLQIATSATNSYQDSGLSPSTTYSYTVAAYDAAGNVSGQSFSVSATTKSADFSDTSPPTISSVSFSSVSSSTVTISWVTNEAADSQIDYGLTVDYGNQTNLDTNLVVSHSVSLSGLLPATTYHYRVRSKDAVGNLAISADYTLTTISSPSPSLPYPDGSVLKAAGSDKIYFIIGGQKRWLTSPAVFLSYGLVLGSQKTVSQTDLDRYPSGPDINQPSFPEGSLIRAKGDFRVWIIKPPYKRHIFNPAIFNMYQHFSWASIKDVESDIVSSYITSDLYRADGDYHVYSLEEIDEAQGKAIKHHLNLAAEQFTAKGYSWNQIFIVNTQERDYYQTGGDLTQ